MKGDYFPLGCASVSVVRGFLVALVITSMVASTAATVGADRDRIEITEISVSPENPLPGEEFRVVPTIRNANDENSGFEVKNVSITASDGTRLAEATNLGYLSQGGEMKAPVVASIDSTGVHSLQLKVKAETDYREDITIQRPVVVEVEEVHPQVSVSTTNAVAGSEMTLNASVANGLNDDVRNVNLTLTSQGMTVRDATAFTPSVAANRTATFEFTAVASEPGTRTVTANLGYRTADGAERTVTRTFDVNVEPLQADVAVEADADSSGEYVTVSVLNLGNAALDDAVVKATTDGERVVDHVILDDVPSQSNRTIRMNTSDVTGATSLNVTASYAVGGRTAVTATDVRLPERTANVSVTGLNFESSDGKVHITGSASNLGLRSADATVVRVVSTEGVSPAYPSREYFVGTVPGSEFVTFELYAEVDDDVDRLPLKIAYTTGDERHEQVVRVPYEPPEDDATSNVANDPQFLTIVGGTILLGIAGMMVFAWRNYDGGN